MTATIAGPPPVCNVGLKQYCKANSQMIYLSKRLLIFINGIQRNAKEHFQLSMQMSVTTKTARLTKLSTLKLYVTTHPKLTWLYVQSCVRLAACVCVYIVFLHRKSPYTALSPHVHGCLSAVSWTGWGVQSQSRFNWCQAGLGEKPSETGDAQRDRKPFIRGLPPTAWLSVSLSVLLSLPISLPLKISHRRSVSICSLPLPLTLSWLQTFTIYHSSSHPGCSLCGIVFKSLMSVLEWAGELVSGGIRWPQQHIEPASLMMRALPDSQQTHTTSYTLKQTHHKRSTQGDSCDQL